MSFSFLQRKFAQKVLALPKFYLQIYLMLAIIPFGGLWNTHIYSPARLLFLWFSQLPNFCSTHKITQNALKIFSRNIISGCCIRDVAHISFYFAVLPACNIHWFHTTVVRERWIQLPFILTIILLITLFTWSSLYNFRLGFLVVL